MENSKATDSFTSGLITRPGSNESGIAMGEYFVECYDKDGNLKWTDTAKNTVVSTGLQNMCGVGLDGTTTRYTTWYVGLKGAGSVVAGDTLASHAGWPEYTSTVYTGNRPAFVPNAVATTATPSVVTNSSSKAQFSITAASPTAIAGALLCNAQSGTSGILFSAGDFSTSRTVSNGDTLQVTYQFSLAA